MADFQHTTRRAFFKGGVAITVATPVALSPVLAAPPRTAATWHLSAEAMTKVAAWREAQIKRDELERRYREIGDGTLFHGRDPAALAELNAQYGEVADAQIVMLRALMPHLTAA